MTSERARSIGRQATSLILVAGLLLFQLFSRADLARAALGQAGSAVLCSGAGPSPGDHGPDAQHACALACALMCNAQSLPTTPGICHAREVHALVRPGTPGLRLAALFPIPLPHIRGPPEPDLV